jgi:myo-inositol 2-dehydrogenase / D-chiro-inositol 1-dehydrogenase
MLAFGVTVLPDPPYQRLIFADVTVHDLDTARWMVGEIEEVAAFGAALSDAAFAEAGDIDNTVVVLHFAGGALGAIDNGRVAATATSARPR